MKTHNLGYPRIGSGRELIKASEQYRAGKIPSIALMATGKAIRLQNWKIQQEAGIDVIPVGDFSYYDQVLDTSLMVGAIPARYHTLMAEKQLPDIDLLFAMARGYQKEGYAIAALETDRWFDTNYHYVVPEFTAGQTFNLYSNKLLNEYLEAKESGINAKPVLLGPISYLLLGREKEEGFHRLELLKNLLPVYFTMLKALDEAGAHYIQFDEPCLSLELGETERQAYRKVYQEIRSKFPDLHVILASYFECYGENLPMTLSLPVGTIHLDLVSCPMQLDDILATSFAHSHTKLSLGVVDGRNIWKNDFQQSIHLINKIADKIGKDRVWIAPSCSLLHCPCDLDLETNTTVLKPAIKQWMAFAKQKVQEVAALAKLASGEYSAETDRPLVMIKAAG